MAKMGFDPICYGTAVTVQRQVGTATARRNFLHRQRNSYGTYGICVTATAKRQWQNGNSMVETRHKPYLTVAAHLAS